MTKWCLNYESGEYEYIDCDGFNLDRGEYVEIQRSRSQKLKISTVFLPSICRR